jgi:hypothetical protein
MIPLIIFASTDPSSDLHCVRFIAFFRLFRLYQLLSQLKGNEGEIITLVAISGTGGVGVILGEINDPSSNIKTLGEGVWWATATIIL